MRNHFMPALKLFTALTLLTGFVYPLAITGIAQLFFTEAANGSLIRIEGKVIGSNLIAQKFEQPGYFWSRPSAGDYNPLPSGGTNLSPVAGKLKESSEKHRARFSGDVPQDLIFASASGLDPHISPDAARFQIERVAQARGFSEEKRSALRSLVDKNTSNRQIGFLGEPRVNVLELNLALDEMSRN